MAVPIFAAVTTAWLYLLPRLPLTYFLSLEWYSIVGGGISALMIWLIFAMFVSPFTTADRADVWQYTALVSRLNTLQSHLQYVEEQNLITPLSSQQRDALGVACSCKEHVEGILNNHDSSLCWLLGKGYIGLWRTFHHAEEALLETETPDVLFREALRDHLRIRETCMSNRDELLQDFTEAVKKLAQSTVISPNSRSRANDTQARREASVAIQEVRRAFNEFKDSRWEGLITLRNRLLIAAVLTENATYLLTSLPILAHVPQPNLIAALAFYLVGALAGMFGRFYGEAESPTQQSMDYGLSVIRLIATPAFSGLAGSGGALLAAVLPTLSGHQPSLMSLNDIFQLQPFSLFIAAVFGLTPNLMMQSLKRQAEAQRPPNPEGQLIETLRGTP